MSTIITGLNAIAAPAGRSVNTRLLQYWQMLEEACARREVEKQAAKIDWDKSARERQAPQSWFDDDDDPFKPEEFTP